MHDNKPSFPFNTSSKMEATQNTNINWSTVFDLYVQQDDESFTRTELGKYEDKSLFLSCKDDILNHDKVQFHYRHNEQGDTEESRFDHEETTNEQNVQISEGNNDNGLVTTNEVEFLRTVATIPEEIYEQMISINEEILFSNNQSLVTMESNQQLPTPTVASALHFAGIFCPICTEPVGVTTNYMASTGDMRDHPRSNKLDVSTICRNKHMVCTYCLKQLLREADSAHCPLCRLDVSGFKRYIANP